MAKPTVLVVGAQKCATTWLYECMRGHPGLFLPSRKREVEYLGSPIFGNGGDEAYLALFSEARPDQVVADVSVEYLWDPGAAERVARTLDGSRVIALIRNPIDRAISAYAWSVRQGFLPNLPLEDGLRAALDSPGDRSGEPSRAYAELLERGHYADQIARFRSALGPSRILVVLYDQIVADAQAALRTVWTFAGVSPDVVPEAIQRRPKVSTNFAVLTYLERLFPSRQGRASLPTKILRRVGELAVRAGVQPKGQAVSPQLRGRLRAHFRPHLAALDRELAGLAVVGRERVPVLAAGGV